MLVVDKLTYAGVPESLKEIGLDPVTLMLSTPRLCFLKADICDQEAMDRSFDEFKPDTIFHLAAESQVDHFIDGPAEFIKTNIVGTATLLQTALRYWWEHKDFVFKHISMDEVYGALGEDGFFTELPLILRTSSVPQPANATHSKKKKKSYQYFSAMGSDPIEVEMPF